MIIEMTAEQVNTNLMIVLGNIFKYSSIETKINGTDIKVFFYCLRCRQYNTEVNIKEIAKILKKSQITISRSLRKLKSMKAIDRDFRPTQKFLDSNILEELDDKDKDIKFFHKYK